MILVPGTRLAAEMAMEIALVVRLGRVGPKGLVAFRFPAVVLVPGTRFELPDLLVPGIRFGRTVECIPI